MVDGYKARLTVSPHRQIHEHLLCLDVVCLTLSFTERLLMNDVQFLRPAIRCENLVSLRSIGANAEKEPDSSFVAATLNP